MSVVAATGLEVTFLICDFALRGVTVNVRTDTQEDLAEVFRAIRPARPQMEIEVSFPLVARHFGKSLIGFYASFKLEFGSEWTQPKVSYESGAVVNSFDPIRDTITIRTPVPTMPQFKADAQLSERLRWAEAISKNPYDATIWGVYADWLEDRGEIDDIMRARNQADLLARGLE